MLAQKEIVLSVCVSSELPWQLENVYSCPVGIIGCPVVMKGDLLSLLCAFSVDQQCNGILYLKEKCMSNVLFWNWGPTTVTIHWVSSHPEDLSQTRTVFLLSHHEIDWDSLRQPGFWNHQPLDKSGKHLILEWNKTLCCLNKIDCRFMFNEVRCSKNAFMFMLFFVWFSGFVLESFFLRLAIGCLNQANAGLFFIVIVWGICSFICSVLDSHKGMW